MVKRPVWIYVGLAVLFVLSTVLLLSLPVQSALREIAALPAIGSLLGALFVILRDEAAFEKQQFLRQQDEAFSLGTASHMANVAFDKHVEFCEKYMVEVHSAAFTLFREGPTIAVFKHVSNFADLRRQYSTWIPLDVDSKLVAFEKTLFEIGNLSRLVDALQGTREAGKTKAIEKMYALLGEVLGEQVPSATTVTAEAVKEHIRAVLEIEELTKLRRQLVGRALKSLEKKS